MTSHVTHTLYNAVLILMERTNYISQHCTVLHNNARVTTLTIHYYMLLFVVVNCLWKFNRCMKKLEDLKMETADQQRGVDIVLKALRTPLYTIAKNAGADPSTVVAKVMSSENATEGYDALKDRYVDMMHEGRIINCLTP